ncbi:MAG TPA: aminoglycoside phosphotransferase family protein [Candidatus Acidoferrum sp.]|jgi:streptomycin 6-kinase|nr:aminoglycoside phosphotransferase family protein [Candidatus Acidoferrum sp.]
MEQPPKAGLDLSTSKAIAMEAARNWGLKLGEPFPLAHFSYVAPAGRAVLKVSWDGDQESLHEGEALELWNGNAAVRLLGRAGRALLEERVVPGDDLSTVPDAEATAVAVDIGSRLWRRAAAPFRPVASYVPQWIDNAERDGSELASLARDLFGALNPSADWLVHGDFHHHNILRRGDGFVAIDPKPYLSDREYDVPSFLWNPIGNVMDDREQTERRIAAFVAAGLDDFRIRAWTVIRGAYLRPDFAERIRGLI